MKNIVISGYFGFDNTGDEALLNATIWEIKNNLTDCNICVISHDAEKTKQIHDVDAIDLMDFNAISYVVSISDLVIVGGGGLFQDHDKMNIADLFSKSGYGTVSYAIVPLIAKMHNKPVFYFAQGIGPLFSKESRSFMYFASELADFITVRDLESEVLLKELCVSGEKILLTADPAIKLKLASEESINRIFIEENIPFSDNYICVNVRNWIDKSIEDSYKKAIAEALDKFAEQKDIYFLFVPFQISGYGDNDYSISKEIIEMMKNKNKCHILKKVYHPTETAKIISKSCFVVGMRYHSIIFAINSHIPFIAISYDQKVTSLVNETGLNAYCLDFNSIDPNIILNKMESVLNELSSIKAKLTNTHDILVQRCGINYQILWQFLENSIQSQFKTDIPKIVDFNRFLNFVYYQSELMYRQEKESDYKIKGTEKQIEWIKSELKEKGSKIYTLENINVDLKSQLEEKNNKINELQNINTDFRSQLEVKNKKIDELQNLTADFKSKVEDKTSEILDLKETLNQRESSLSWRFSQYYGKYFSIHSPVTKVTSHVLNKMMKSIKSEPYSNNNAEEQNRYKLELNNILEEHKDKIKGIIIYPPTVDWNIPLFQRPQQLALQLSREGYLFFFSTGKIYDRVEGFQKIEDRCYVTDRYELLINDLPEFILLFSSTNAAITLNDIQKFRTKALIVYEYIDEISEEISGTSVENIIRRHEYMIKHSDVVIATADKLFDDVTKIRQKDVYLNPNGVDYEHFHITRDPENIPSDLISIIKKGNPIIGYYGALATWFDYNLIIELAERRPDYEIVLIGWDYDNSMKDHKLDYYNNIHYLGVKKYPVLPEYAIWFDVAIIPFVLNEITESTSPIKIFEYMALGVPIVTTDMRECRKYRSVLIGRNYVEFIQKIDESLKLKKDNSYLALLDKEAKENTWKNRAQQIDEFISLSRK